jgi:hypothetical protein
MGYDDGFAACSSQRMHHELQRRRIFCTMQFASAGNAPGQHPTLMCLPISANISTPSVHRVIAFVDNAGADIVLGMLPLARELLRMGSEVVLAANTQPAINDITAAELRAVVAAAVRDDPILRAAWDAGLLAEGSNRFRVRVWVMARFSIRVASRVKGRSRSGRWRV